MLNQLSHPGAPTSSLLSKIFSGSIPHPTPPPWTVSASTASFIIYLCSYLQHEAQGPQKSKTTTTSDSTDVRGTEQKC